MSVKACPACASANSLPYGRYRDEEYVTSTDSFDYWQCGACGTVYLYPLPVARLAEIYPSNYYSFRSGGMNPVLWIKERLDAVYLRRVLRGITADELAVLDVGGGAGRMLDLVRSLDRRVRFTQVVDLDPAAGEAARAAGHTYECRRIEEFASPRRFHLVLMLNLIEHVAAPREVLANIASFLAPRGLIVVKTPNLDATDARIFRPSYWAGLHVPRHWTVFTRESFDRMLGRTGLEVRRFDYTQGAPFWAASVLAAWRRRGWASISPQRPVVYHPMFAPLSAIFAAIDLARAPWARTSQMRLLLGSANAAG
jgi:SAM-dependent methyltransferase